MRRCRPGRERDEKAVGRRGEGARVLRWLGAAGELPADPVRGGWGRLALLGGADPVPGGRGLYGHLLDRGEAEAPPRPRFFAPEERRGRHPGGDDLGRDRCGHPVCHRDDGHHRLHPRPPAGPVARVPLPPYDDAGAARPRLSVPAAQGELRCILRCGGHDGHVHRDARRDFFGGRRPGPGRRDDEPGDDGRFGADRVPGGPCPDALRLGPGRRARPGRRLTGG